MYPLTSLGLAMKIWLTCFILLFGAAEVLHWIEQFSLPLPMLILGGAFLAIASNYDKLTHLPFHLDYEKPDAFQDERATAQIPVKPQTPVQDDLPLQRDRARSQISFTINKPHQPGT